MLEKSNSGVNPSIIIDVREQDEFESEYVPGSIHVPLSRFSSVAPGVLSQLGDAEIGILCRSGKRAEMAQSQIRQLGYADRIRTRVLRGGILEWKRAGKPVVTHKSHHLPIMRQVQLVAGFLVFGTTLLGSLVNPLFFWLTGFVGLGLMFAGSTGFCGMAIVLGWMPWNRS